jgi:multidrug efflux pump subunit AcrA (membrane-fusion protein)
LHFPVFYDYAETRRPDNFRDAPMPTETSATVASNAPVASHSIEAEMEELRQQVQLLKKQTVTTLDQAKKSFEHEQAALLQAQNSLDLEKAATLKATRAVECENYMLDLMTDASEDMAGALSFSSCHTKYFFLTIAYSTLIYFDTGSFLDATAEEHRVSLRVNGLMRLAIGANVDLWANETRCRRIVQF